MSPRPTPRSDRAAARDPRGVRPGPPRPAAQEEISAGGLVVHRDGTTLSVALIARRNRAGRVEWCLPKGHLEGTETLEQAAVREIHEETGIRGRVLDQVGIVDYWFNLGGRRVHKTVHHYLLEAIDGVISVAGDPDAEAFDAAWVPLQDLEQRLSFVNERRIARAAAALLITVAGPDPGGEGPP